MYAFNKHNNKMNITQQKLNVQNKKEKGINSSTNSLNVDVAKDKRYQQHKKSISFFNKLKTKLVSNIDLDLSHYLQTEPFGNNTANVNMHYKINNKKHKIHNAITPNTSITHSQKKMKILANSIKNNTNNNNNKIIHTRKTKLTINHTPMHKKSESHSLVNLANLSFNSGVYANTNTNNNNNNTSIVKETKMKVDKTIKHNILYNFKDKKDKEPTKIFIKDFRKHTNTNNTNSNAIANNANKAFKKQFLAFKHKALKQLETTKQTVSPKSKYQILKNITNDLIKLYPKEHLDILIPLFTTYHSIYTQFSDENKSLQEQLSSQNTIILNNNKQIDVYAKELQIKEQEIDKLKKIINNSHSNSVKSTDDMSKRSNSFAVNEQYHKERESKKKLVQLFNQQNYQDLDAIYFVDKVDMDSKSTVNHNTKSMIPSLQIESNNEEESDEEEPQIAPPEGYYEDNNNEYDVGEYQQSEYDYDEQQYVDGNGCYYYETNQNEDIEGKGYHSDGDYNYGKKFTNNSR
jgi:hypothetical protein